MKRKAVKQMQDLVFPGATSMRRDLDEIAAILATAVAEIEALKRASSSLRPRTMPLSVLHRIKSNHE